MMKKKAQENSGSLLICANESYSLESLPKAIIIEALKVSGILLLRNFNTSINSFSKLVEKTSARVTIDPARNHTSEKTQLVDAGTDAIGLHIENGNTPFLPDCLWFFCEIAAKEGSQTTYCDGKSVWESLSEKSRDIFKNKKIKYQRNISEKMWQKYLSAELGLDTVTVEHLMMVENRVPGLSVKLNDDQSIWVTYSTSAVHIDPFSGELYFANSLLGPSYNYEKPIITFEDNSIIPEDVLNEVTEISNSHTKDIAWENGDIAIINNKRVMHGRREIMDVNRKIHVAMSYLI